VLFRSLWRLMVAAVAGLAAIAAGCATARLASGWAQSPVTANGLADDWSDRGTHSIIKDGLQLTVANDDERLYVTVRFRAGDQRWSRAASHGGVTLRVAGPGKRSMSLRLARGPERAPGSNWQGRSDDARDTIRNGGHFGHVPVAEFGGKLIVTDVEQNVVPVDPEGSQGPAAGFSSDNGMCVYEFSVPLQDTLLGHYSLGAGVGAGLNLTVTAGPDAAQREALREQRPHQGMPEGGPGFGGGEGGPGGRGAFGGGGAGRGGPPGGAQGGQTEPNPSLSATVKLAAKP